VGDSASCTAQFSARCLAGNPVGALLRGDDVAAFLTCENALSCDAA
jgi:hypothetical protein